MKDLLFKLESRFIDLLRKPLKSKEHIAEKEDIRKQLESLLRDEIAGLSEELKKVGSKYTDPWDLVNTKEAYPEAVDVLVKHISKPYHDRNKEGIFRSLTVKEAKGKANAALITEYNKIPKEKYNLRWVIGNALNAIITKDDVESIIPIIQDKSNGMSREGFVLALGKIKSQKGEEALLALVNDEEMIFYALDALGRLKSKKALTELNELLATDDIKLKKAAERTIEKISS